MSDKATAAEQPELVELCARLDREPLFHASLGSKELFHSNMLEWFSTSHPNAAAAVFSDWTTPSPGTPWQRTQREWRHLDLVVHVADQVPLVIENKVFSPPLDQQLERYTADVAATVDRMPVFALLSLVAPSWPDGTMRLGDATWRHHSYGQLADSIETALDLVPIGYARDTVSHYRTMIRSLQRIADLVHDAVTLASDIRLAPATAKVLASVRLDQGFEKLRTRIIADKLADHLRACGYDGAKVADGYMRSWPIVEWFVSVPGTKDELGWQLQEGQWRLAVRVLAGHEHHGRGAEARARREAYVAERYAAWFDFSVTDEILGTTGATTATPGSFRAFAPDFVYLYRPAKTLTVSQLSALATSVAEQAAKWTNEP